MTASKRNADHEPCRHAPRPDPAGPTHGHPPRRGAALRRLALALTLTLAPGSAEAQSSGPMERTFSPSGFDAVDVGGFGDVRIRRGGKISVVTRGDPRPMPTIRMQVVAGVLYLDCQGGSNQAGGSDVEITLPVIRAVSIRGAGDVTVDAVEGQSFDGTIHGSGSITVGSIKAQRVRLDVEGAGNFAIHRVAASDLEMLSRGSGDASLDGAVTNLVIRSEGAGDVDARRMSATDISVTSRGSGKVLAHATRTAGVSASGSGNVSVSGHPRCSIRLSGWAHVSCN